MSDEIKKIDERIVKELIDKNDKVRKEIFEEAPIKNELPCVSFNKIKRVLEANGFRDATSHQCP